MTADADVAEDAPRKASKLPLVFGFVLAILGAGGGFYAVQSGVLSGSDSSDAAEKESASETSNTELDVAFVAIDPLVISLPGQGGRDHLRFAAQLEVRPDHAAEVEAIRPRIVDVLNGYLRAIDIASLEDPATLPRLRAQMLRRIQVVTGPGRVDDILIMEFVLS
ncbi:flagellar basal body-associated FliL family protein [Roseobacter sp. CCS2]|uniref:flagellar basal body-associated FliL family protein n=1 Tax=Roseobacter sp. CCS2 TaxID=391593 RepID=UPI0000F401DD|nr:flagellar basal body-associated FliL family protein [Roseobacter sp. CCS2]EBA13849.1 flagellar basal body-associated protein FliL [Roseobacter sp. CCS2]